MADLHDIEAALVALLTQAVYPNGTGNPSAVSSAVAVYRGWPLPNQLDLDLAGNVLNVSVYPQDTEQRTTRYTPDWHELPLTPPMLTITASGQTLTLAGTPSSPLNVAALVNQKAYIYPVQPGDTLTTIATGLATLVNVDTPATSSGSVVTIPAAKRLIGRIGAVGTVVREIRRQKRGFQITCWCPTPAARDALAAVLDNALAAVDYLCLPDGTAGRLVYERSRVSDAAEKSGLYRRDLFYSVEYGTTQSQSAAQIVAELLNIARSLDNAPLASFTA